jgi:hypothetical protein
MWHFLAFHVLIGLLSLYSPIKYFSSHSCMDYLSLFLHAIVADCLDMPVQVHLCCHTSAGTLMWMCLCKCISGHASADASVQTCLRRCTCVDLHLWLQPCGHASAGELCGHACSGAFKVPLQMNLCRHGLCGQPMWVCLWRYVSGYVLADASAEEPVEMCLCRHTCVVVPL